MKCKQPAANVWMLNGFQISQAENVSRATGTPLAEISKQNFRSFRDVLPPKHRMAAVTAKVAPLNTKITAKLHQFRTLASLRDTVLAKLLSGELSSFDPA